MKSVFSGVLHMEPCTLELTSALCALIEGYFVLVNYRLLEGRDLPGLCFGFPTSNPEGTTEVFVE